METDNLYLRSTADKISSGIPFATLLNNLTAHKCSEYSLFENLEYYCDYSVNDKGVFVALPIESLDTNTRRRFFDNPWEERFGEAVAMYVERNLSH